MTAPRHKVVVYTAITGGYDVLPPVPAAWRDDADFVAFMDEPQDSPGWEFRRAERVYPDPTRNARMHKILAHRFLPGYDYSVWVDGSVQITSTVPLSELISRWLQAHDIALFRHRVRTCVYDEAEACITAGKDSPELIRAQIDHYRAEGYPAQNGLHETMVLIRRHSPDVREFCEGWHGELVRFSRRDQLSMDVALHRHRIGVLTLPGLITRNDHFQWHPHRAVAVSAAGKSGAA